MYIQCQSTKLQRTQYLWTHYNTANPLRHYYKRRPTTGVLPMIAENRNSCETGKKFLRFYISRLLVHSLPVHSPSFVQKSFFTKQMNLRKHSRVEGLAVLVCILSQAQFRPHKAMICLYLTSLSLRLQNALSFQLELRTKFSFNCKRCQFRRLQVKPSKVEVPLFCCFNTGSSLRKSRYCGFSKLSRYISKNLANAILWAIYFVTEYIHG